MPRDTIRPNRLACDRCHAQKLRCQRQESQCRCVRCSRAGTACVFSPRQRRAVHSYHGQTPSADEDENQLSQDTRLCADEALDLAAEVDLWHDSAEGLDLAERSMAEQRAFDLNPDGMNSDLTAFQFQEHEASDMLIDPSMAIGLSDWFSLLPNNDALAVPGSLSSNLEHNNKTDISTAMAVERNVSQATADYGIDKILPMSKNDGGLPNHSNDTPATASVSRNSETTAVNDWAEYTDPVQYVRELAELNVRLFEHAAKLPAVTTVPTDRVPSLDGQMFAIDEMFRMTQSFIDLLKSLYPTRSGSSLERRQLMPTPDQATLLLIMSCTNRVFDVYETIFGHMRACIQHNITPVTDNGKTIVLPQVRIGAFAPPTPSAIAMHMLLIVLMASELFNQLQDVLGCWRFNQGTENDLPNTSHGCGGQEVQFDSRGPEFTEEVRLELARRAEAVAIKITKNRDMLLDIPGLARRGFPTHGRISLS